MGADSAEKKTKNWTKRSHKVPIAALAIGSVAMFRVIQRIAAL